MRIECELWFQDKFVPDGPTMASVSVKEEYASDFMHTLLLHAPISMKLLLVESVFEDGKDNPGSLGGIRALRDFCKEVLKKVDPKDVDINDLFLDMKPVSGPMVFIYGDGPAEPWGTVLHVRYIVEAR